SRSPATNPFLFPRPNQHETTHMNAILRYVTLVGLALLLSACGFALRGSQQAPVAIDTVVLRGDVSSALTRQLREALESVGVTTVIAQSANYVLTVGPERLN